MIRVLAIFLLIAAAAVGAVWLADNPGEVTVVWLGAETKLSIGVALVALALILAAMALAWSVLRFVMRLPRVLTSGSLARRREKGLEAAGRGLMAVGAGDAVAARRHAQDARRHAEHHPLSLLLDAQAAQLAGDRAGAHRAFAAMTTQEASRLLGWRGLFVEARRAGDEDAARAAAAAAVAVAPAAAWANEALLTDSFARRDWPGARQALERAERLRVLDKATSKRHRAVLLTAEAQDAVDADPARALTLAREACDLAPDLTPAAALAARLLGERGDLKKASRLIETAWKAGPHPDLARVYVDLRAGDSALDRLQRAQALAKLTPGDPEGAITVAGAALDAREIATARAALAPLAADQPTIRVCLMMADLAELDGPDQGATRYWLARAARAPRDKTWIADGATSDRWLPMSPATGRLDAFVWAAPPERLAAGEEPAPPSPAPPAVVDLPAMEPPLADPAADPSPPAAHEAAPPAPPSSGRPTPVIFPIARAPDDPGAKPDPSAPRRWRAFNG